MPLENQPKEEIPKLDLQPYKYSVDPYTGKAQLDKIIPYVRFGAFGLPDVFFQSGHYFYENGELVALDKLQSYGLIPKPKTDQEASSQTMEPPAEVKKVVAESESATLRAAAIRIAGRPIKR